MKWVRSRIGRAALALLLLVATQLAFAGQLCEAVTLAGGSASVLPHAMASASEASKATSSMLDATSDARDCCPSPVGVCASALGDVAIAGPSGSASSLAALPPAGDSVTILVGASSVFTSLPAATGGPPLPAYIVFRRFLS
jgi:hypothetical protein